jgi:hypothetical protein
MVSIKDQLKSQSVVIEQLLLVRNGSARRNPSVISVPALSNECLGFTEGIR